MVRSDADSKRSLISHHRFIQAEDKHPQHHGVALSLTHKAESHAVQLRKGDFLSPQRPPIGRLLVDMRIIDYKTFESCLNRFLDARQKHSTD